MIIATPLPVEAFARVVPGREPCHSAHFQWLRLKWSGEMPDGTKRRPELPETQTCKRQGARLGLPETKRRDVPQRL